MLWVLNERIHFCAHIPPLRRKRENQQGSLLADATVTKQTLPVALMV
jgi:hypothetical protein